MARSAAAPRVRFHVGSRASLLVVSALVAACAGGASRLPSRGLRQDESSRVAVASADGAKPAPETRANAGTVPAPAAIPPDAAPKPPPTRSAPSPAAAPVPAEPEPPAGETANPVVQQVRQLRERELQPQALVLVDAALAEAPTVELRALRADLLRDVGRRSEARAEWNRLRREAGPAGLPPEQLVELAELEWMEGDAKAATATLQAAQAAATGVEHAATRALAEGLAGELTKNPRPRLLQIRDLLGSLRGAESPRDRLATLESLWRAEEVDAEVRRRALAIASSDEAASVRARAVQLVNPAPGDAAEFVVAALADRDGLVRRYAVARAEQLLGAAAAPLLVDQLQREGDEATFTAIDAALCRLVGGRDAEPFAGADAEGRRRVAAAWRQHLEVLR
ncbi:MAG: hypothetical protein JNL12_13005 [Planctomycetes bacterium]|nr:hypothetical protein [Planctomycetota bacterium]